MPWFKVKFAKYKINGTKIGPKEGCDPKMVKENSIERAKQKFINEEVPKFAGYKIEMVSSHTHPRQSRGLEL